MRVVTAVLTAGLAACAADGGGGGQTAAGSLAAAGRFDGAYQGTAQTLANCFVPRTEPMTASIVGGRLTIPHLVGAQSVTGVVRADGQITQPGLFVTTAASSASH